MEEIFIYAKPHVGNVIPYTIIIQPTSSPVSTDATISLLGSSFWNIRNVYLSSLDFSIFNKDVTLFDPFSAVKNLSAINTGFYGIMVDDFVVNTEKYITFDALSLINQSYSGTNVYVDVIVENEAGFGVLSVDSRVPFLSSTEDDVDIQKPCVNGINFKVLNLEDN
jgi:hypothetical protein